MRLILLSGFLLLFANSAYGDIPSSSPAASGTPSQQQQQPSPVQVAVVVTAAPPAQALAVSTVPQAAQTVAAIAVSPPKELLRGLGSPNTTVGVSPQIPANKVVAGSAAATAPLVQVASAANAQSAQADKQIPSAAAVAAAAVVAGTPSSFTFWQRLVAGISFAGIVKALCMAGNVMVQWCFYGVFAWWMTGRTGFLILLQSNFLGAVLGSYYTNCFYRNCRHEGSTQSLHHYLSAVIALVLFQVCAVLVLPPERALFLCGLVASFCSFVGALSILVVVPSVIKSKDSRAISGPLVMTYFMSSLVWVLCGWMLGDPLICAPNVTAVLASSTCLWAKHRFPSLEQMDDSSTYQEFIDLQSKLKNKDLISPEMKPLLKEQLYSDMPEPERLISISTGGTF